MPISLTRAQIDAALPRVAAGLEQYQWLQRRFSRDKRSPSDAAFRRRFTYFYRIRRNSAWRETYYSLMTKARRDALQFHVVLDGLRLATGRLEASFASKLIATISPNSPVIDRFVLRNVGLSLPSRTSADRVAQIRKLYEALKAEFDRYLRTADGRHLVTEFHRTYPNSGITEVKMLDLVLWQTRR